jgi:DNA-damage-inducible protein J
MRKSAQIRARIEPEVKEEAEAILEELGISPTVAITMLYKQIIHQQGLPFTVAMPNETTRRAISDAREGRELIEADSMDALVEALDADD